jgi:hypothetical protein
MGTFYVGWLIRWANTGGVDPEVAKRYEYKLEEILGESPRRLAARPQHSMSLTKLAPHVEALYPVFTKAVGAIRASTLTSDP